jgi:hypothetical protein
MGQVLVQGQAVPPVANGAAEAGDGMGGGDFFNSEMAGETPFPDFPLGQVDFPDLGSVPAYALDFLPGKPAFPVLDRQKSEEERRQGNQQKQRTA